LTETGQYDPLNTIRMRASYLIFPISSILFPATLRCPQSAVVQLESSKWTCGCLESSLSIEAYSPAFSSFPLRSSPNMAKNYTISSKSRWPRDPWFSTHTGYEESPDRRSRISDIVKARSGAAQSCGQELGHEAGRQTRTDATFPVTHANHKTKGNIIGRIFQTVPISLICAESKRNADSRPSTAKEKQQALRREGRKRKAGQRRQKRKRDDILTDVHRPSEGRPEALKAAGLLLASKYSKRDVTAGREVERKLTLFDQRKASGA